MEKKVPFITLASVIAAFAVITLHTNGCFWSFSTDHYWFTANIVESCFYFSVPVFFMITGATLLDFYDKYSMKVFFQKRIVKTVIPLVIWTFFGIAYKIYIAHNLLASDITLRFVFDGLTKFNVVNLYWFFGPLFCVYLSVPLLAAVQKEKRNKVYGYVVVVAFAFNSLIPFINNVFTLNLSCPLSVSVGSGYLLYVLLGYLLTKNEINIKLRITSYVLASAGLLAHIIGTYKLSIKAGQIIQTYKGYNNVPCILYSVGVYIAIRYIASHIKSDHFWKIIGFIGKYTFPMYLMQWFLMDLVRLYLPINTYSLYYRLGAPIPMAIIIILVSFVLRKIPIVRHIVP